MIINSDTGVFFHPLKALENTRIPIVKSELDVARERGRDVSFTDPSGVTVEAYVYAGHLYIGKVDYAPPGGMAGI